MRQIGIADEGADPYAAVGQVLDPVEPREVVDVSQTARPGDAPFIRSRRLVPAARYAAPGSEAAATASVIVAGLTKSKMFIQLASARVRPDFVQPDFSGLR